MGYEIRQVNAKKAVLLVIDMENDFLKKGAPLEAPAGPDDLILKKHRYSAFFGTDLEMILRGRGVETVIVGGVTSEDCVHASARDAMFRDFHTIVLWDCCATYDHPAA